MLRHALEGTYICVLPHVYHRPKEQSCNPDRLLTQGPSVQQVQTMGKIESNNQGQISEDVRETSLAWWLGPLPASLQVITRC